MPIVSRERRGGTTKKGQAIHDIVNASLLIDSETRNFHSTALIHYVKIEETPINYIDVGCLRNAKRLMTLQNGGVIDSALISEIFFICSPSRRFHRFLRYVLTVQSR
jgi:hypothetical protein